MRDQSQDVAEVLAHVGVTIGERDEWTKWPGGWPDDIESALVDAVFSARAIYRSADGRGVHANVTKWRGKRTRDVYSLDALVAEIAEDVPGWADRFGSRQVSPGRPDAACGGRLKAATVREAACVLLRENINVADQIDVNTAPTVKRALCTVPGIGFATSNYFLMLLGAPGVKPDRMIRRFLKCAAGHAFTNAYAEQVLQEAAQRLGAQPHELDHAIWCYESARARKQKR